MKRRFALLMVFALLAGLSATAEQPDTILFRDIPWLTQEPEVANTAKELGFEKSWYAPVDEDARIDGWYSPSQYVYGDPDVENGGVILRYDNVRVAGYTADLELLFLYPILDGRVCHDLKSSMFYRAEYQIEDLEDIEGAYAGLKEKLTQLYGTSEPLNIQGTLEGTLWTAKDDSLVWLSITYNSTEKRYDELRIIYAAPNTNEMLAELDEQIRQDTADDEAQKREENAGNFDGL